MFNQPALSETEGNIYLEIFCSTTIKTPRNDSPNIIHLCTELDE